MRPHRVVHDKDRRFDVHDVIFVGFEEQPVVEQRQLRVARGYGGGARCEQPTYYRPSRYNVGAQQLVRRMYNADDESDEIAS